MMLVAVPLLVVPLAFALDTLRGGLEWVVLVITAVGALGIAYRFLSRIAKAIETMIHLIAGDANTPGLGARLEGLEREMTKLRLYTTRLTDLARDEHVKDVRDLLRRGEVPHPLLEDDDVTGPGGDW